jgi:hypothetical protein
MTEVNVLDGEALANSSAQEESEICSSWAGQLEFSAGVEFLDWLILSSVRGPLSMARKEKPVGPTLQTNRVLQRTTDNGRGLCCFQAAVLL